MFVHAYTHVQLMCMGSLLQYAFVGMCVSCERRGYVKRIFTHVYVVYRACFDVSIFCTTILFKLTTCSGRCQVSKQ